MFKLMFLIGSLNAPMNAINTDKVAQPNIADEIKTDLIEEVEYFEFIEDRMVEVMEDSLVDDNGGTLKCVQSKAGLVEALGEAVDFESASVEKALASQRYDLAEFHLLQLTEVVDKAQGSLSEAEECVATLYANAN